MAPDGVTQSDWDQVIPQRMTELVEGLPVDEPARTMVYKPAAGEAEAAKKTGAEA